MSPNGSLHNKLNIHSIRWAVCVLCYRTMCFKPLIIMLDSESQWNPRFHPSDELQRVKYIFTLPSCLAPNEMSVRLKMSPVRS